VEEFGGAPTSAGEEDVREEEEGDEVDGDACVKYVIFGFNGVAWRRVVAYLSGCAI
jgi:hypothetical protein